MLTSGNSAAVKGAASLILTKAYLQIPAIKRIDRFGFYERTRNAFAVVMTGETAKYGNILLKKGVTE